MNTSLIRRLRKNYLAYIILDSTSAFNLVCYLDVYIFYIINHLVMLGIKTKIYPAYSGVLQGKVESVNLIRYLSRS